MNSLTSILSIILLLQLTSMVICYYNSKFITRSIKNNNKVLYASSFIGPRPIHKEFTVEKVILLLLLYQYLLLYIMFFLL